MLSILPKDKIFDSEHQVKNIHEEIMAERRAKLLGFYDLPENSTRHIDDFIANLDPVFDTMLVLGIGGPL
jgi:hypothetical protein